MSRSDPLKTLRRHAIPIVAALAASVASLRWGGMAGTATLLLLLPVIAWRYDNRTGAFFVLALLFVIVVGIMGLLVALMALRG